MNYRKSYPTRQTLTWFWSRHRDKKSKKNRGRMAGHGDENSRKGMSAEELGNCHYLLYVLLDFGIKKS